MPYGQSDIPDLRLSRLNKLITKFDAPPRLKFVNMFASERAESDTIKWESQTGTRGMVPFKAPGAKTPQTEPKGVAGHQAKAAFFGEKMPFDEEFLNNLREPGTDKHHSATKRLAREMRSLRFRVDRRKEWMFVKMLSNGGFDYLEKGGVKTSVDYAIPASQQVTLGSIYKWGTGGSKDILSDLRDAKLALQDAVGADGGFQAFTTQTVLRYMIEDSGIRDLFRTDAFSNGSLLGPSAGNVLGVRSDILANLLDMPITIYDEKYTVDAYLTSAVTADSTTVISVSNTEDFEVGGSLTFYDVSAGTSEAETISAIDPEAGTVTVSTAPSTSYKAAEDKVMMTRTFLPPNKFCIMVPTVDNVAIAEYLEAPFGLTRSYGMKVDRKDEWDPEATWIRAQGKGLPVLYHPDAIYTIDVE